MKLRQTLSGRERNRADRYRFARHRDGFTFGRGVLRTLLQAYTGVRVQHIAFVLGPHGKPSLSPEAGVGSINFNYSDAGGHALYGFCRSADIGVDLEDLQRQVKFERIAQRKFTGQEAAAILSLPAPKQRSAFLACWTRKEGYGKAEGWGINYPLNSVELCLDCQTNRVELRTNSSDRADWVVAQLYPSEHFVGTVVYPTALEGARGVALKYMTASPGRILRL